ncbi:MAG TPA: GNAT family N-acetyltransferase [Chloroflexia bacterium]|nr:GNAT family N-acetyltransferase [Chloroflexia bacterium]
MEIRLLTAADVDAFWTLRLEALQESPDAFGSSYAESVTRTPEQVAQWHRQAVAGPDNFMFGAFEGQLAGMVGCRRDTGMRTRHKAVIWGMYVAPEARGQGTGRRLMEAALAQARTVPGLEQLYLAVVTTNPTAVGLYTSLGFATYGREPRALKSGARYFDEELMALLLHAPAA